MTQEIKETQQSSTPKEIKNKSKPFMNKNQWLLLAISIFGLSGFTYIGINHGWWEAGSFLLGYSIIITVIAVVKSFSEFTDLFKPGEWFDSSIALEAHQERLMAHYSRIHGTLKFWKSKAKAHHRLHASQVLWGAVSGVILPVLIQLYDKSNNWATIFMTVLTTWNALLLTLSYTLSSREQYRGYRQQESDFYDVSRLLLNTAKKDDPDLAKKVDDYISVVTSIRKVGRRVETDTPPSALER